MSLFFMGMATAVLVETAAALVAALFLAHQERGDDLEGGEDDAVDGGGKAAGAAEGPAHDDAEGLRRGVDVARDGVRD